MRAGASPARRETRGGGNPAPATRGEQASAACGGQPRPHPGPRAAYLGLCNLDVLLNHRGLLVAVVSHRVINLLGRGIVILGLLHGAHVLPRHLSPQAQRQYYGSKFGCVQVRFREWRGILCGGPVGWTGLPGRVCSPTGGWGRGGIWRTLRNSPSSPAKDKAGLAMPVPIKAHLIPEQTMHGIGIF